MYFEYVNLSIYALGVLHQNGSFSQFAHYLHNYMAYLNNSTIFIFLKNWLKNFFDAFALGYKYVNVRIFFN